MRILHVLCSNVFSGAENVACQIINIFKSNSDIEMVYCSPDGRIREALEERHIQFYSINKMSYAELKRAIKEVRPDIIHAHDMRASFYAALACGNLRVISHIHNNSFESRKLTIKALLYQSQARKYAHIFWVSQAAFDGYYYKDRVDEKSSILRNLIDINEVKEKALDASEKDSYDIVYLGRMTYPKNPERVIDVIEKAVRTKPSIRAALVGQGELQDEVESKIKNKKLCANVDMLGFKFNPYGVLKNAKLMLMTSRWEGLPMCALEAMSLGVPIVSTPTDGLKEVVDNGITGYLATTDDELSERCLQIIENEALRLEMSKQALKRAMKIMNVDDYRKAIFNEYKK